MQVAFRRLAKGVSTVALSSEVHDIHMLQFPRAVDQGIWCSGAGRLQVVDYKLLALSLCVWITVKDQAR